jgi:hypothetical protein
MEWVAGEHGTPALNAATENFAADPWFEILGSGASADDVTFAADGGVLLTTDGAASEAVIILPHLDPEHAIWDDVTFGTDDETEWECLLKVGTIADDIGYAGLKLTNVNASGTDADQAYFRFENGINSGNWQSLVEVNTALTTVDTGVLAATGQIIHLKVVFDAAELCNMFVNGKLVSQVSFVGNTVDLKPYIGILDGAGGSESTMTVYGQKISRLIA